MQSLCKQSCIWLTCDPPFLTSCYPYNDDDAAWAVSSTETPCSSIVHNPKERSAQQKHVSCRKLSQKTVFYVEHLSLKCVVTSHQLVSFDWPAWKILTNPLRKQNGQYWRFGLWQVIRVWFVSKSASCFSRCLTSMDFQKPLHHHMPKGHQHAMAMRCIHKVLGVLKLRCMHWNLRDVCTHVSWLLGALQQ